MKYEYQKLMVGFEGIMGWEYNNSIKTWANRIVQKKIKENCSNDVHKPYSTSSMKHFLRWHLKKIWVNWVFYHYVSVQLNSGSLGRQAHMMTLIYKKCVLWVLCFRKTDTCSLYFSKINIKYFLILVMECSSYKKLNFKISKVIRRKLSIIWECTNISLLSPKKMRF